MGVRWWRKKQHKLTSLKKAALMEAASEAYYKYGVSAEGLRWVVDHCGVAPEDTTSDVCHRILKPATVGEGWENIPVLTDEVLRYYDHEYRSLATGTVLHCGFQQSDIPPPGSRPYCEVRQSHRCRFVWRRFGRHAFLSDCCVVAADTILHRCCSKIQTPSPLWGARTSL